MKATIEIPDDLYRQVKAKSALEGRPVREVTEALFRRYVGSDEVEAESEKKVRSSQDEPTPTWFGVFKKYADKVPVHDMESIRKSVAAGIAKDLGL